MQPQRLIFALTLLLSVPSLATDSAITVHKAWAAASPGAAPTGAAYLVIENGGDSADQLLAAAADVAQTVEIHATTMENNVMKMEQQKAVEIPPGESVSFAPGGLHVMFIGLHAPLVEGDSFPLTLRFDTAGEITVTVEVMSREQGMSMSGHGQH